jgi:hypothetical protein
MIEIKGRKFEGPLAEMIENTPGLREMLEDVYTIERDEDGEAITIRWD